MNAIDRSFALMTNDQTEIELKLTALKSRFKSITGGDELAAMDIEKPSWLIDNLMPVGLTILGGPKKLGKSYLVMQFAKQIIDAEHHVFYFAGEETFEVHKERQEQVGIQPTAGYQFVAGRQSHFATPENFFESISEILRLYPFKAIFIDVMEHCIKPAQVRDYSYYMKELGRWAKLAHLHRIALVMVTHTGKNAAQNYSNPIDHLIGSTGIGSAADWILTMMKTEDGQAARLHSEGKMGKATTFSMTKRNGIFYEIDGLERDRLIQKKEAQNAIYEFVCANPGKRQVDIARALGMDTGNVSSKCKKLVASDYLVSNSENCYFPAPKQL